MTRPQERTADAAGPGALRRTAASGVRWTSASAGVRGVLGLVQVAVLARLLGPEDFGLAATATVVLGFAALFSDLGLNNAVIARRLRDRSVLASLYWTNVIAAAAIGVLAIAAAPAVAAAFGEDRLAPLVRLGALVLLAGALGTQFQLVLQRDLRFRPIAVAEVVSAVLGFVAAVAAAVAGAGPAAVVLGMLTGAAVRSASLAAAAWDLAGPARHLSLAEVRNHVRFGAYQVGDRLITFFGANVDYLLIGLVLGPEALGLYYVAYQLVVKPYLLLNPALTRVAFPVFAQRGTDPDALRRGFLEVTRLVAFVVGPVLAGVVVAADHIVPVLFGPQFAASVVLVQLLAVVGLSKGLTNPIGPVLLAKDRPDIGFRTSVAYVTGLTAVLAVAVHAGLVETAVAYVGVAVVVNVVWPFVLRRVLGLGIADYARNLRSPLTCAAATAGAMGAVLLVTGPGAEPHAAWLAAQATAGALAAAAYLAVAERAYVREVAAMLIGRRRTR